MILAIYEKCVRSILIMNYFRLLFGCLLVHPPITEWKNGTRGKSALKIAFDHMNVTPLANVT